MPLKNRVIEREKEDWLLNILVINFKAILELMINLEKITLCTYKKKDKIEIDHNHEKDIWIVGNIREK